MFCKGLRHGIGTSESNVKGVVERYEGFWSKGLKDSFSKHTIDAKTSYLGFYKKGRRSGAGRLTIDKHYDFTGYFSKNIKSVFGKEID